MIWIVVGLAVVAVALFAVGFNKLRRADLAAQEALAGIDVQLMRRADLVPNLVATVQGYAAHESGVLTAVTAARTAVRQAAQGGSVTERAAAESALDRSLIQVMAVAEAYPQLAASQNFQQLQTQLAETEDQVAFARQYYNDAVRSLNTAVTTIPWMVFAGAAGVGKRDFFDAPDTAAEGPRVQF